MAKFYLLVILCSIQLLVGNGAPITISEYLSQKSDFVREYTANLTRPAEFPLLLASQPLVYECTHVVPEHVLFINTIPNNLYMLTKNELFYIRINQQNSIQFTFVGQLEKISEMPSKRVKLIYFEDLLVIGVQKVGSENISVLVASRMERRPVEISFMQTMEYKGLVDFDFLMVNGSLKMVVLVEKKGDPNKMILLNWHSSFMTVEDQMLLELPDKNQMEVSRGAAPLVLVTGFDKGTDKKILLVISADVTPSGGYKLKQLQKMFFAHGPVQQFITDDGLNLIGCSDDSFCAAYRWSGFEFQRRQILLTQLAKRIKRIDTQGNITLVADDGDQLKLYQGYDLGDSYLDIIRNKNRVEYGLLSGFNNGMYYVEILKYRSWLKIYVYLIKDKNAVLQQSVDQQILQDPITCVYQLKDMLMARKSTIHTLQVETESLKNKTNPALESKNLVSANSILLKNSTVEVLIMPYNLSAAGSVLLEQVMQVNINRGILVQRMQEYDHVHQTWNERGVNFVDLQLGITPPPATMDTIVVKRLIYKPKESIFSDVLIRSKAQLIGQTSVESLKAEKIVLEKNTLNGIPLDDVVTVDLQDISILGQKVFEELHTTSIILELLNDMAFNEFLTQLNRQGDDYEHLDLVGNIFVSDLNVREINGFRWSDFVRSVYRKDKRTTLKGNLVFLNTSHVGNLQTNLLQGSPADLLMTTSTDQKISCNMQLNKFKAHTVIAEKINGQSFSQIALLGQSIEILSPIKILTIHVNGPLKIEPMDSKQMPQTFESLQRHIIGSTAADLSQIYSGRVRISGSLTLRKVILESGGKLVLKNQSLDLNLSENYWLKNTNQKITGTFSFNNAVDAVQVTSKLLNSHPLQNHLLLDPPPNWIQGPVNLKFTAVTVAKNILSTKKSKLNILEGLAVKRGQSSTIRGPVQFRDSVTVKHLNTRILNGVPTEGLVHKKMVEIKFSSPVTLKSLNLNNQSISIMNSLQMSNYNGINLKNFFQNVIRVNKPFSLKRLHVDNFSSNNLTVGLFENHQFDLLFRQLQQQFVENPDDSEDQSPNEKNLRIRGDAIFSTDILVNTFNDEINLVDYLGLIVDLEEQGETFEIGGDKIFLESVTVNRNLNTRYLNDFELDKWFHNSLQRQGRQTIRGRWNIQHAKAKNWRSKSWQHKMINKKDSDYQMHGNLKVNELVVENMKGGTDMNMNKLLDLIQSPSNINWMNVTVEGDAKIPIGSISLFDDLISFGICKTCGSQTILEKVTVLGEASVENIIKNDSILLAETEPVDMLALVKDSLKRRSVTPQIVIGSKSFANPLYMRNMVVIDEATLNAIKINDVDIQQLNLSLFRVQQGDTLFGRKTFYQPIQVHQLITKHRVHNLPIDSLIFLTPNGVHLNHLTFDYLSVQNLQVTMINQYSLNYLLENRVRKQGMPQDVHSQLTFDHLEFVNDATITSINNLPIDDIVFLKSSKSQEIFGHKIFLGNLTLIGPSNIQIINDYDVLELYKTTTFTDSNQYIEYMQFPAMNLTKGLLVQHFINQKHINVLIDPPKAGLGWIELVPQLQQLVKKIKEKANGKPKEKRFLYIDHNPTIKIVLDTNLAPASCYMKEDDLLISLPHYNQVVVKQNHKQDMSYRIENLSVYFTLETNLVGGKCNPEFLNKNLNVFWASHQGENFFQNFTFDLHLEDIQVVEPPRSQGIFMVLTFNDRSKSDHMVAILELNKTSNEWHESKKIEGLGNVTEVHVVFTNKFQLLIVCATKQSIVLRFDLGTFKENQRIQQRFDLVLDVQVEHYERKTTFLLMGLKGAKKLAIYKFNDAEQSSKLVPYQEITFDSTVNSVKKIDIEGFPYFLLTFTNGNIIMYQWLGIEGWQEKQRGYLSHVSRVQSYDYLNQQNIVLFSSEYSATALTVYKQGKY